MPFAFSQARARILSRFDAAAAMGHCRHAIFAFDGRHTILADIGITTDYIAIRVAAAAAVSRRGYAAAAILPLLAAPPPAIRRLMRFLIAAPALLPMRRPMPPLLPDARR